MKMRAKWAVRFHVCSLVLRMSLLAELQQYRASAAARMSMPIFCVFGDTVLQAIAQSRPTTMQGMLAVRGMTDEKCSLHGSELLRIVAAHGGSPPRSPSPPQRPQVVLRPRQCKRQQQQDQVYILELLHGRVYVGRTSNLRRRLDEHAAGRGSAFTRLFPPTGVRLPRLGRVSGSGEAAERDETLRYMFLRGLPLVRGWKYTRPDLTQDEQDDAESNIRELFDLCRRCGHPGHFVGQCKNNYDRHGRMCWPLLDG